MDYLHYRSRLADLDACGNGAGTHIMSAKHFYVKKLREAYCGQYLICRTCLDSKTLEDDYLQEELGSDP